MRFFYKINVAFIIFIAYFGSLKRKIHVHKHFFSGFIVLKKNGLRNIVIIRIGTLYIFKSTKIKIVYRNYLKFYELKKYLLLLIKISSY